MKINKRLYQWDINQSVAECKGEYVDYIINSEVYRVRVVDGTCRIPDEFLQTSGMKTVYECYADGTIINHTLNVTGRPMPPDYVFTPTQKETFDSLVAKVNTMVDNIQGVLDAKMNKHIYGYDGTHITENGVAKTYAEVYADLMEKPDFAVLVSEGYAYHPNMVNVNQIVFVAHYPSNGYSEVKRITLLKNGTVTLTSAESEKTSSRVSSIAGPDKQSTTKYPSVKAVVDYVDSHSGGGSGSAELPSWLIQLADLTDIGVIGPCNLKTEVNIAYQIWPSHGLVFKKNVTYGIARHDWNGEYVGPNSFEYYVNKLPEITYYGMTMHGYMGANCSVLAVEIDGKKMLQIQIFNCMYLYDYDSQMWNDGELCDTFIIKSDDYYSDSAIEYLNNLPEYVLDTLWVIGAYVPRFYYEVAE